MSQFDQFMNTFMPIIIPIIFIVVFFSIIYSNKKEREALRRLSSFLSGAIPKFSFMPTFKGEYQGLKLSIMLTPAGKHSPPYLKISLVKNSSFNLTIYKESFLSNLGKKLGLVREVKINDEMFDKEFLMFSNKPTQAMAYLNNVSVKNAVRELFANGFNGILINGKQILIQKPNYTLEKDLEYQSIMANLQKLSIIARGL